MADFVVSCILLMVVSSSILICGSDQINEEQFPTSSNGFPPGTDNRSDFEMEEINDVDSSHRDEMSRMMENHLLQMLKLSSRPSASVAESLVPGYIRALQHAADAVPLSTVTFDGDDRLTWALKALQVTASSSFTRVYFNMAAKSRDSAPWRVELVFESQLPSTQASVHRGRAKVDMCHVRGVSRTVCHQWKPVRYRQYDGHSRRYSIYDVTVAVAPSWSFCYPEPCRLELRVHGVRQVDVENTSVILVVYQNMIPDIRATRRALRSVWSRHQVAPIKQPQSGDERHRRGIGRKDAANDGYCHPYKWLVDFRVLNWTWIVAPNQFEAGYCAGKCPGNGGDLERVNLTNHAFLRMVHRAWTLNVDGGRLPTPSCVSVRFMPLSILYQTDENTFQLRNVNEMVSTACGCL